MSLKKNVLCGAFLHFAEEFSTPELIFYLKSPAGQILIDFRLLSFWFWFSPILIWSVMADCSRFSQGHHILMLRMLCGNHWIDRPKTFQNPRLWRQDKMWDWEEEILTSDIMQINLHNCGKFWSFISIAAKFLMKFFFHNEKVKKLSNCSDLYFGHFVVFFMFFLVFLNIQILKVTFWGVRLFLIFGSC